MKVRCSGCLKHLRCICPPGVLRYKWYSQKLEGIFALLDVHQVDESCADEIAGYLGYPVKPETRARWQATRAWRADRLRQGQPSGELTVASLDEFKVGQWWAYTLTDGASQAVVDYALSESRNETVVRDLLAEHDASAFMSDGCLHIKAACEWFADKPHGRCWFHVIKEVLNNVAKEERDLVAHDLKFLYTRTDLKTAEWFLDVLQKRYTLDVLEPLLGTWPQLKLYWLIAAMPLTNNISETLYSALWSRSRKTGRQSTAPSLRLAQRSPPALEPSPCGKSPWQRFTKQPSRPWLPPLLAPLGRSHDFWG